MVNIEINGQSIQARKGSMVIEVADEAGITIPRFCYHSKLSIAASCRMCLVEVEKAPKALPACATPVSEGMKVFTRSPKAIAAQRSVMEFLLINHPLDCPICDQGGECDLQEMAVGFGKDVSRYQEGKRVVADPDLGPLVATDMTRCIHCTRCVRFGQEIAGIMELGAAGRGEHMHIGTYMSHTVDSELSGNVIDLCPVGALTSKPYRFSARPWELASTASISPHDCVGANVRVDVRGNKVMRVVARSNDEVNEEWIADRDRFSYSALTHEDRLTAPMIKKDGQWLETDWDTALSHAAEGIRGVIGSAGAEQLGALSAYTATNEEAYLLQKLIRALGSNNIDHRLHQLDLEQADVPAFPYLGQAICDIENLDAALLIGSNIRKEQPLLSLRLRKASRKGAAVMCINPVDYDFNFTVAEKLISDPAGMLQSLAGIAKALLASHADAAPSGLDGLLANVTVDTSHRAVGQHLADAEKATVLLGNGAMLHPQLSILRRLAYAIAEMTGARFGVIAEGGNAPGAWLAGCVPHRMAGGKVAEKAGLDWREMLAAKLKAYVLFGVEPELDCADSGSALAAMQGADFIVSLSAYATDRMREYADVLLPIAMSPETSGSFVNTEGRWQDFTAAVSAPGEARPAWKILRVLGNICDVTGFEYMSSEEVRDALQVECAGVTPTSALSWQCPESLSMENADMLRIGDFAIYASDPMVRRATALQSTADAQSACLRANAAMLKRLGIVADASEVKVLQGEASAIVPLVVDERVADGCIYLPSGVASWAGLGLASGPIALANA